MGLLSTRWEAKYEGHNLTVSRNEIGRGFKLEWDGRVIASRSWSWVGLGELHGSAEIGERHVEVHVKIEAPQSFKEMDGHCTIAVDGTSLDVVHVK